MTTSNDETDIMSTMNASKANIKILESIKGIKGFKNNNEALTFVLSHFKIKSDVQIKDERQLIKWDE